MVKAGMSYWPSKPPLCHPRCRQVLVVPKEGGVTCEGCEISVPRPPPPKVSPPPKSKTGLRISGDQPAQG